MSSTWRSLRGWIVLAVVVGGVYAVLQFVVFRPDPLGVEVVDVERGLVEEIVANTKAGSLRARMESNVSTDVPGTITEIVHREGQVAKKGDALIRLDARSTEKQLIVAERGLDLANTQLEQARLRHEETGREYKRLQKLAKQSAVSEAELEKAETANNLAQADFIASKAGIEQAQAQLEEARIQLEKRTISAPFDGVIAELYVETGEWATPGSPLLRFHSVGDLFVEAELDEVDIGRISVGLPVRITLDPYRDRKFFGTIHKVSPYVSETLEQNRTVRVEVEFDADTDVTNLRPGTSADIEVIVETTDTNAIRVPTMCLMENDRVLVFENEVAVERELKIGLRNWEFAQVVDGLNPGDRVITSLDSDDVKDGAEVVLKQDTEE